jgi:hypothetical protein
MASNFLFFECPAMNEGIGGLMGACDAPARRSCPYEKQLHKMNANIKVSFIPWKY